MDFELHKYFSPRFGGTGWDGVEYTPSSSPVRLMIRPFNLLALSGDCKVLIFRTENGICGFLAPAGGIYEPPGYLGPSQDMLGVISFSIQAQEKHLPAGESSCSENKMGSCLR